MCKEKLIKINGMEIEPINFNEELNSIRKNEKNRHETFNKVLEANLEGVQVFLKDKCMVELETDDEHSLNKLHFTSKSYDDLIGFDFTFDDVASHCNYTNADDISSILKDYVISLVR